MAGEKKRSAGWSSNRPIFHGRWCCCSCWSCYTTMLAKARAAAEQAAKFAKEEAAKAAVAADQFEKDHNLKEVLRLRLLPPSVTCVPLLLRDPC